VEFVPHASDRLARAVVAAIHARRDPKTFAMWAREAGTSESQLRAACRAASVHGRVAHDVTRLLRSSSMMQRHQCGWSETLDCVEHDTLRLFLRRCGVQEIERPGVAECLARQKSRIPALLMRRLGELLREISDRENVA
jgi:hypothetical protein